MLFTAAVHLYGQPAWQLACGACLAARLWELDGQLVVALGCPGGASWMLGTPNCLNGAVITIFVMSDWPFVSVFSLIVLS